MLGNFTLFELSEGGGQGLPQSSFLLRWEKIVGLEGLRTHEIPRLLTSRHS